MRVDQYLAGTTDPDKKQVYLSIHQSLSVATHATLHTIRSSSFACSRASPTDVKTIRIRMITAAVLARFDMSVCW